MIDCNITKNYIHERNRMCDMYLQTNCKGCVYHTKDGCWRGTREYNTPENAIRFVQSWSDKNPPKTYLSEFIKAFPHCRIHRADVPFFCLKNLGVPFTDSCNLEYSPNNKKCQDCWNTPIEESEETE